MSKLGAALRERFKDPKEVMSALGLDAALLAADESEETKERHEGKLSERQREDIGSVGSEKREEQPESAFLEPASRKYPVKEKKGGEWKYDRRLLLAAARRARLNGNEGLAKKADAIREREFGTAEDSALEIRAMSKPTKFANLALQLTASALKPVLAKDEKFPNLMPIFKGVTSKNFKAKEIKLALDEALKGSKLAQDAEAHMGHVAQMLDHIEHNAPAEVADESVSEEQHKAMEAAAHGNSTLGIPEKVGKEFVKKDDAKDEETESKKKEVGDFLRSKGMDEEKINAACDMMFKKTVAGDDASAGFDKDSTAGAGASKEEGSEKDKEEAMRAEMKAKDEEMKDMVKKPAMDAAIAAAKQEVRATERAIRQAFEAVRPWTGDLPSSLAFDSADEVYRHAAVMIGVPDAKTVPAAALPTMIKMMPKPGAKPVERREPALGMDEAAVSDFNKMFPEAARISAA